MKKFAFLSFRALSSQAVGMLDAGRPPAVRQAVQEASDALGEDLGALIAQGPKEALAQYNTQPVMLLAGVAAGVWQAEGGALPDAVAGHSLGEYSALVAAGVLSPGGSHSLGAPAGGSDAGGGAGGCRCHGCGIGFGRRQGQSRAGNKSRQSPPWWDVGLWTGNNNGSPRQMITGNLLLHMDLQGEYNGKYKHFSPDLFFICL